MVVDLIGEISAASVAQPQGIAQVNKAVIQMDSVIQQNASQTPELSSTAQGLAARAVGAPGDGVWLLDTQPSVRVGRADTRE